jgi:hypothetical protein
VRQGIGQQRESLKLVKYSNVVGIPYNTLKKYVSADEPKRRVIGKGVGRQPIVLKKDQYFVADVLVRKDHGNNGATPSEALDMINDLHPKLSREQARDYFRKTLKPNHRMFEGSTSFSLFRIIVSYLSYLLSSILCFLFCAMSVQRQCNVTF